MTQFLGEFECKLDAKGRLTLPSALMKQLSPTTQGKFVINRGFEKCLTLFPNDEWQKESAEVNKLNIYIKQNREFVRSFNRGATALELDGVNRVLIPKQLLDYAGVDKEVILSAFGNRIEIWNKSTYENLLNEEPEGYAKLAEEVMGKLNKPTDTSGVS